MNDLARWTVIGLVSCPDCGHHRYFDGTALELPEFISQHVCDKQKED